MDVLFTVLYTLIFAFLLGMGLLWWRQPHKLEVFLRGTVFEHWTGWLVPWMTWSFVAIGVFGLAIGVLQWSD